MTAHEKDQPVAVGQQLGGLAGALTQEGGNALNVGPLQRLHSRALHLDPATTMSWLAPAARNPTVQMSLSTFHSSKVTMEEGQEQTLQGPGTANPGGQPLSPISAPLVRKKRSAGVKSKNKFKLGLS